METATMTCKGCGDSEDRVGGFCSIICKDLVVVDNLKKDVKDLKTLCNRMLEAITDKEVITAGMLEDWGQEMEHIEHRGRG